MSKKKTKKKKTPLSVTLSIDDPQHQQPHAALLYEQLASVANNETIS